MVTANRWARVEMARGGFRTQGRLEGDLSSPFPTWQLEGRSFLKQKSDSHFILKMESKLFT